MFINGSEGLQQKQQCGPMPGAWQMAASPVIRHSETYDHFLSLMYMSGCKGWMRT